MSDAMLLAILRAPYPDDPEKLGLVEWNQLLQSARQAADEIERLTAELEPLTDDRRRQVIGRALHEAMCKNDPQPEDQEWEKLTEQERYFLEVCALAVLEAARKNEG